MCGIGGIINLSQKATLIDYSDISIMRKMLSSRGPDAEGVWRSEDKNIILLIQRLSTQDNRQIANQPCWSNDKNIVAILNGEIYNHNEINEFLTNKGYKFFTRNDTEVIANAYHYWGKDFLNKIHGQFALVVFNKISEEGIVARDEHGISPLFYADFGDKFYFSSTPESIQLQSKQKLNINKKALSDFMISGCISEGNTFFDNIKYLGSGHFLEFKSKKKLNDPKSFVSPTEFLSFRDAKIKSENEYIEEIYHIIKKHVNSTTKGDKEVGIYLSGGLDSSIVLGLFKQLSPEQNIKTFTASFENIENKELVGEHDNASNISKFYKCENTIIPINDYLLLKSIGSYSQPSADILELSNHLIAKEARKNNVEVALSGEGADEMFFGYDHNLALVSYFKKGYEHLSKKYKLRSNFAKNISSSKAKIEDLFLVGGGNIDLENNRKSVFSEEVSKTTLLKDSIKQIIDSFNLVNPDDVDKISVLLDYYLKVPELHLRRAEGPSMEEGVELRFPFLQKKLKDLLYIIPLDIKIGNEIKDKSLLRKVAKKIIPDKLLSPKMPFGASGTFAFRTIFCNHHSIMKEVILNGRYSKLNLFNENFLKNRIQNQSDFDNCYFDVLLWKIWNIAQWYEKYSN